MPRHYQIQWRDSDEQELRRVVRNFNAKLNRLEKKNPSEAKYLPKFPKIEMIDGEEFVTFTNRLSVSQMKELIHTRQDLKRELNSLKRFSKRGAETLVQAPVTEYENVKLTKWQKTEMNRRVGYINRRRKKRLDEIKATEMTSRRQKLGYTRGEFGMGTFQEAKLSPMNAFTSKMDSYDLKWKWMSIRTESQTDYFTRTDEIMRQNYIKGIKTHYDYERVKDIIEEIENMDIKEFLKVYEAEGGTFEQSSPEHFDNENRRLQYDEYLSWENALRSTWLPKSFPRESLPKQKPYTRKK